jgi:TPR repeat protein
MKVQPTSFSEFIRPLRGEPYVIDRSTVAELSQLAQEFGCEELTTACSSFQDVEQSHIFMENQIEAQHAELCRLRNENWILTEEVSRLSRVCSTIEKDVGVLKVTVANEVHYRRGCEYLYGTNGYGYRGVDISKLIGISELKHAADSGHSDAQYVFGRILRDGPGLGFENAIESTRYMKLSANQGNSYGEFGYGRALIHGYGIMQNECEGFAWYESSALHGNARGQNACGFSFWNGKGVKKNLFRAAAYYKLGADQGNAGAINGFGISLREVSKDEAKACEYFKMAADLGNVDAMNSYGWCLENGLGVRKDPVEAVKLYRMAADEGHALAQRHFARCLESGIGVEIDLERAREYYKRAADQGDAKARQGLERSLAAVGKRDARHRPPGLK